MNKNENNHQKSDSQWRNHSKDMCIPPQLQLPINSIQCIIVQLKTSPTYRNLCNKQYISNTQFVILRNRYKFDTSRPWILCI